MNFIVNRNMPDDMKTALKKFGNIIDASVLNIKDKNKMTEKIINKHKK